ncbi:MAG: VOC family protein [Terriglobales bacterium]
MKFFSLYSPDPKTAGQKPSPEAMTRMQRLVEDSAAKGTLLSTGMLQPDPQGGLTVRQCPQGPQASNTPGMLAAAIGHGCGFAVMETASRQDVIAETSNFLNVVGSGVCELVGIQEPAFGLQRQPPVAAPKPFLWFNDNAEPAVEFYLGIFPNSCRLHELRNSGDAPGLKGGILTLEFELNGQTFIALNGGPAYQFSPAVSFYIACRTQDEIDYYWSRLSAGGREIQCGWLQDRFGLSWQVGPHRIHELLRTPRAMQAMMKMVKFDLAALQAAAEG